MKEHILTKKQTTHIMSGIGSMGLKREFVGDDIKKYQDESHKKKSAKIILFVALGIVIGAINGFFGAGGGMLAVPVLSFVGGLSEKKSHATAIAVMLPLCLVSAIVYGASDAIEISVLIPTSIGVLAGGIIGAKLLNKLPGIVVFFAFQLIMLIVGFKMLF